MPLYDYRCADCAHVIEDVLYLGVEPVQAEIPCDCGGRAVRLAAKVAKTNRRWGDSHSRFIPALGGHIPNSQAFDRACDERGLAPVGPSEESRIQSCMDRERRAHGETARVTAAIEERAAELGPEGDRVAKAEATSEILTPEYLEHESKYGDTM